MKTKYLTPLDIPAAFEALTAHYLCLRAHLTTIVEMTPDTRTTGETVGPSDDYGGIAEEMWEGADYGEGDYHVTVNWEATDNAGNKIGRGSFNLEGETAEPECEVADKHDWTAEGETSMSFRRHCRHCGMRRLQCITGSQCNPGNCDTTSFEAVENWCAECQSEECTCEE